jgi:hypothetical protein
LHRPGRVLERHIVSLLTTDQSTRNLHTGIGIHPVLHDIRRAAQDVFHPACDMVERAGPGRGGLWSSTKAIARAIGRQWREHLRAPPPRTDGPEDPHALPVPGMLQAHGEILRHAEESADRLVTDVCLDLAHGEPARAHPTRRSGVGEPDRAAHQAAERAARLEPVPGDAAGVDVPIRRERAFRRLLLPAEEDHLQARAPGFRAVITAVGFQSPTCVLPRVHELPPPVPVSRGRLRARHPRAHRSAG